MINKGWHVPTKKDKTELKNYLKVDKMGIESLKETDLEKLENNIQNSASQYIGRVITNDIDNENRIAVNAFIAGAYSLSAKEYWQQILKANPKQ